MTSSACPGAHVLLVRLQARVDPSVGCDPCFLRSCRDTVQVQDVAH